MTAVPADVPETRVPSTRQWLETGALSPTPDRSSPSEHEAPYRFIGRTGEGPDAAIVLFGRGRTVTLTGPGLIDDEHVAEAVYGNYIVVRHLPSGSGAFLWLTSAQRAVSAPQDAEQLPRD